MKALFLNYNDVLASPGEHLSRVREFLDLPLDRVKLAAAVDAGLQRQRAAAAG